MLRLIPRADGRTLVEFNGLYIERVHNPKVGTVVVFHDGEPLHGPLSEDDPEGTIFFVLKESVLQAALRNLDAYDPTMLVTEGCEE